MTLKEMKKEIEKKYNGIPERQIATGLYLDHVGRRYVHILNTWEGTALNQVPIDIFYFEYCE